MERDLVIVGAGPAGIAAAESACRSGTQVTLIDENPSRGGQIWRGSSPSVDRRIELLTGYTVVDANGQKIWLAGNGGLILIRWRRLILATGARELFLPFPGWTLPGVVGVGGLQALSKGGLCVRDKLVVIAGSGPLLLAVAAHVVGKGAEVIAIAEQAALSAVAKFGVAAMQSADRIRQFLEFATILQPSRIKFGWWVKEAKGTNAVSGVVLTNGIESRQLDVDFLACSWGLIPNTDLASLLSIESTSNGIVVNESLETSQPQIWAAGECTGIGGVEKSVAEGRIAGTAAAGVQADLRELRRHRQYASAIAASYRLRREVTQLADLETVVCRCENVTLRQIANCSTMREAKLQHRFGMGACQGRICGGAASTIFDWNDSSVRSPLTPTAISLLQRTGDN